MKGKVLIIAEAGVNHNGDIDLAHSLIDEAYKAGADIVKFQTFQATELVIKSAEKAEYQKISSSTIESQWEMLKNLELTSENHFQLIKHCETLGIEFLTTAFDLKSLEFLTKLNLSRFKIPSGEITNFPYLKRISELEKPIILSTGMSDLLEVENAIQVLRSNDPNKDLTILHCNTEYPTPMEDVNLNAMLSLKKKFKVNVGYSDHTSGIEIAIAAVALGAKVIEKHLTLDKTLQGPDHQASLNPLEFKNMVNGIRNIELALGDGVKRPSKSESKNIAIARKSLVAKESIREGELFSEDNMNVKRPGNGISPMRWNEIIGQKAKRNFNVDDLIEI